MYRNRSTVILEGERDAIYAATTYAGHVSDKSLNEAEEIVDVFARTEDQLQEFPVELSDGASNQIIWALRKERTMKGDDPEIAKRRLLAAIHLRMLSLTNLSRA